MKQIVLKDSYSISGTLDTDKKRSVSSDPVQKIFNNVPLDITVSESRYDTKMYSAVLLIALCIAIPPLIFIAAYTFFSANRELSTSISKFEKMRDEMKKVKDSEI